MGRLPEGLPPKPSQKGDLDHLENYEIEWREAFGKSLSHGASKRVFLETHWNGPDLSFEDLIRKTWVGFKEYYADREESNHSEQRLRAQMKDPRFSPVGLPGRIVRVIPLKERKTMEQKVSPRYVQTSLAASLTLGFQSGSFHRNAKLKGLNLLLHYEEGCSGRCHFCGLSRSRRESPKGKTFIRVDWPLYSLEEIVERSKSKDQIHRVCISMITHPKALEDTLYVIQKFKEETTLFISVLITPTLIREERSLEAMKGPEPTG